MNGTNLFKIALRALANNKLRAFLTMLGALDGMKIDQLLGTLAGDDTVLLIMRNSESAAELATSVKSMLR